MQLSICKQKELFEILSLCKTADNFFNLSLEQIYFMVGEIQKDFPDYTLEDFKQVIFNGIKGKYDEDNFQQKINMRTIYSWFKEYDNQAFARYLKKQK